MLYRDISKILSYYLFGFSIALGIPLLLAVYYEFFTEAALHPQTHSTAAFAGSILICLALGFGLYRFGKYATGHLFRREALVTVVTIWFMTPAVASVPFMLSGTLTNPFQAYFEAASGFSTTGATVMAPKQFDPYSGEEVPIERSFCGVHTTDYSFYGNIEPIRNPETGAIEHEGIEAVSKALLFWRSFTQWFGGMGIIVLFIAILPALGVGGRVLFQAEVPGPIKESLTPRIKETALQLWKIYAGLTLLEIFFLRITNSAMTWLEAVTVAFSTLSTGGFTIHNQSIGYFDNVYTEAVIIVFMILGSINFAHYFYSLRGKFYRIYEPEFFLYLIVLTLSCCFSSWMLIGTDKELMTGESGLFGIGEAFRYGVFQMVSAQTSTGFVTANYDIWPYAVQSLMLIVMYLGGMSGSTAGGMKMVRHYMLFRIAQYKVESIFRPETVRQFRVSDREVDTGASIMVLCYFLIVAATAVFGTFFFILDGSDPETALGLTTCMVNNIGIGFRMDGPMESCAFLSNFGLVLSSILMLLGRLEFFAVLTILVPAFWRRNS